MSDKEVEQVSTKPDAKIEAKVETPKVVEATVVAPKDEAKVKVADAKPVDKADVEEPTPVTTKAVPEVKSTPKKPEEEDLDDLDDLLDDFADDVLAKPPGSAIDTSNTQETSVKPDNFDGGISDLINDMNIEDPETQKQFADLVKQFESNHRSEVEEAESNPNNFEHVMKETMERLKKSGTKIDEKAKNDALGGGGSPEDMMQQLLAGMGDKDMDMSKFLVEMLEQLSSKEVLYEPIKDLNSKFPAYLEENKSKLSKDKLTNYNKQYDITKEILAVFDAPDYNDNDKPKREQVNALLETLQDLGQPPSELVGDLQDFPGFGGGLGAGGAGGLGGLGAGQNLDFDNADLPKDIEKELAEGCKPQ